MIKLQVIGNLGSDATITDTGQGGVVNFSVAHSEKVNHVDRTTWVKCAYWGGMEKLAPFLTKGTKVYVEGYPAGEAWKNDKGEPQAALKMNVIRLELLSSKKDSE